MINITVAIQFYETAADAATEDHAPLANLAAAYFEIGNYRSSVSKAEDALRLLSHKAGQEASKQRLSLRLAKARILLNDLNAARQALEHASHSDERLVIEEILASKERNVSGVVDAVREQAAAKQPCCKPQRWERHDLQESLEADNRPAYTGKRQRSDSETVGFMRTISIRVTDKVQANPSLSSTSVFSTPVERASPSSLEASEMRATSLPVSVTLPTRRFVHHHGCNSTSQSQMSMLPPSHEP